MLEIRLPTLLRYHRHLEATTDWLLRSIDHGRGGSCGRWTPGLGWSRPYPETTGYLIPTLLRLRDWLPSRDTEARAIALGRWLLEIQAKEGFWYGLYHPPKPGSRGSVFNTGQVLLGLTALHRHTNESQWLEAAVRGARWIAGGAGADGLWSGQDYQARETPSYYTHLVWPLLEVWERTGDAALRAAGERALAAILARRLPNGAFRQAGFREGEPAFSHTIAYTLRGLQECARLLGDWPRYGEPATAALELLARRAELAAGRLPGAFDDEWKPRGRYVCLTGNAQIAESLLLWEARAPDLRLVNAAAKLVDSVCDVQRLRVPLGGLRGAVAGSSPLLGRYLFGRYPNHAAKFHADALMSLMARVQAEARSVPCASS